MADRRQTTYTTNSVNFYDRLFSALSFTWAGDGMLMSLAPIFEERIGRQPKRGESVYDYDNKTNVSITPIKATALKTSLEHFLSSNEVRSFEVTLTANGQTDYVRTLKFMKPGMLKLKGSESAIQDISMCLTVKDRGGETSKHYHVFAQETVAFETSSGKENLTIHSELDALIKILDLSVMNATNIAKHGASQTTPARASAPVGAKPHGVVVEEETGEDSAGEAHAPSPSYDRESARRSLREEFRG